MMAFLDKWRNRKLFIIAGGILVIMAIAVIFPIEKSKAITIAEFHYTYLTLIIGVLLSLYGFLGTRIFTALLFMILSAIISSMIWFMLFSDSFVSMIVAIWIGFPVGLLVGLIFVIVNALFLEPVERKRWKLIKQVLVYVLILSMFTLLFYKGGL
ncbi:hypothetical protein [Pedobacter cryoconitis]|nr:hypothetical protein [Pedobacter cryoconitis]